MPATNTKKRQRSKTEYPGLYRVSSSLQFPDGSWLVRFRDAEGHTLRRSFATKQRAVEFWKTVPRGRGRRSALVDVQAGETLLADVAEEWFSAEQEHWRPKTAAGYRAILDKHILPALGDRQIGAIRARDIEAFRDGLGKVQLGTRRNIMRVLSPIFDRAVRHDMIPANPVKTIRRERRKGTRKEMLFLSAEQVRVLAEEIGPELGTLIDFAAYSGMRFGEIAALKVRNVDLLHRQVKVIESVSDVNGEQVPVRPKSDKTRTIKLAAHLRESLEEQMAGLSPDAFVFGPHDAPMRHTAFYQRHFKPAVRRALPEELHDLRFHDLRHTCASLLIHANVNPKAISDHLGHSGIQITLDLYGHLYPEAREAVGKALDQIYEEAPKPVKGKVVKLREANR